MGKCNIQMGVTSDKSAKMQTSNQASFKWIQPKIEAQIWNLKFKFFQSFNLDNRPFCCWNTSHYSVPSSRIWFFASALLSLWEVKGIFTRLVFNIYAGSCACCSKSLGGVKIFPKKIEWPNPYLLSSLVFCESLNRFQLIYLLYVTFSTLYSRWLSF